MSALQESIWPLVGLYPSVLRGLNMTRATLFEFNLQFRFITFTETDVWRHFDIFVTNLTECHNNLWRSLWRKFYQNGNMSVSVLEHVVRPEPMTAPSCPLPIPNQLTSWPFDLDSSRPWVPKRPRRAPTMPRWSNSSTSCCWRPWMWSGTGQRRSRASPTSARRTKTCCCNRPAWNSLHYASPTGTTYASGITRSMGTSLE